MNFDIEIEVIKAGIITAIFIYISRLRKNGYINKFPGWKFIYYGFFLLSFSAILDITDNIPSLSKFVIIGDTPVQAILEKVVGFLTGSFLILIGFIKFIPYLIELKKTKEELEIKEEQLQQAQKMESLGQLAGGIAHDFNNMLGAILNAAELLKISSENLDSESKNLIDIIMRSTMQASELTSKLLSFGRKGKPILARIDIHNIISDTLTILERSIDKHIKITKKLNAQQSLIMGDSSHLQNAILNICLNAAQAMDNDGEITIVTEKVFLDTAFCNSALFQCKPGDYVKISISDTGTGIPEKYRNKIFEPFFTTKEKGKGTGLGLSTVFRTVTEHKGIIDFESEVNKGTTFYIYLPLINE